MTIRDPDSMAGLVKYGLYGSTPQSHHSSHSSLEHVSEVAEKSLAKVSQVKNQMNPNVAPEKYVFYQEAEEVLRVLTTDLAEIQNRKEESSTISTKPPSFG